MDKNVVIGLLGSAILAYIVPKLAPYIDSFVKKLSNFLVRDVPTGIKGVFRKRRLNRLKGILEIRFNDDAVMFQMMKAHTYFLLFWGAIGFYLILLFLGPLVSLIEANSTLAMFCVLPIYVAEYFWLVESRKVKNLVKMRGYKRITQ
ncbi:hypothetical protein [Agarivorans aestuarii]|uniref:hypothetical protein n=1 Tax=Agarivorans aestuarii TaxID=1563703 RepID=UPI001C7EAD52|nr:hypothetical protein [Agarivorans aestuarii]